MSAPQASETIETGQTLEELAEAREYGRIQLACELADKALDVGYLAVAAFGFGAPLDAWLIARTDSLVLRFMAMFGAIVLGHFAVSLPLSFYSGLVVERRFGLSQQSTLRWWQQYAKRVTLTLVFGLLMFAGLYAIVSIAGAMWWLVAAAVFFAVSVLLGQLVPVLILPLFYTIERLEGGELVERFGRLAQGTGLSIEGVYRMAMSKDTVKANAMLAGLGQTRRVILGDTLLDGFAPEEIDVILAHEIGHHVHRHIPKLIAFGAGASCLGLWLCDRGLAAWLGGTEFYRTGLPIAALPLVMFLMTLFSLVLEPVQNVLSRRFERQCDTYALVRTRDRAAYRAAFHKLARLNKDDPDPHPVEVFLFHSHPPIGERIALADHVTV
ncbi:MAG: M48 family metallopeptidase [Pirellulales bacterium]|nr:M48 family metallopeptidase [Pirellulales bacterium]